MKAQQVPANQLNLFESDPINYSQLVTDIADELLEMLNEGRKREKFRIEYSIQQGKFVVLIATNIAKQLICNVVDIYGNIPKGMTPNWRIFKHCEEDLLQKYNVTIKF